jgi:hypothetical protein
MAVAPRETSPLLEESQMTSRLLVLLAGVALFAPAASAQSRDPYFTDASANYDVVYHEHEATSNAGAHFDIASTLKRSMPFVGPVGEVGFNHFEGASVVSVLGGLRLRANADRRVLPFAQLLVGLYHLGAADINDFALQGGGGVDFPLPGNKARIRAGLDIRHVFDNVLSFNAVRLSAGVVLPLNR